MSNILKKLSGSTRRVTFGLSLIQLVKAFLSFFTVIISSTYFGTSLGRDVWLLSLSIIAILGALIFGPVFEIFRVKFVMLKEGYGEQIALKATGSLLTYMLIISVLFIIVAEILPSILGKTFAPSYTFEQQHSLQIMIRLIAPTILFSITISILTSVLNIYSVFYVPEIMAIFSSILNVIIIILFAPKYGIYSLVFSGYLSNVILIFVLILIIFKSNIPLLRNINFKLKYFFDFFKFALPFYFNYAVAQILVATERIISTFLGIGSLSVLDYARKFTSIPISVIQSTINTVLTATFTKIYIKDGSRSLILEMNKFIDMILLITLPLITVFIVSSVDIVKVFLQRGAFEAKFIEPTAQALAWFGFGIIAIVFYSTGVQALLAQGRNKISALISGSLGFLVLSINLLFYKTLGIQALAFSWSFGHFLGGITMYFLLSKKDIKLLSLEFLRKFFLISSVLISCYLSRLFVISKVQIKNEIITSIFNIVLIGFVAVVFEIVLIYFLKFKEKEFINRVLKIKM